MATSIEHQLTRGRWVAWMTYPLALLILGLTLAHGMSLYDSLPDRVPTHWGPSGAPDAFDTKSPGNVYGMLWVGIAITAVLAFLSAAMPAMAPARRDPSDFALVQREGMIRGATGALGLTSIGLAALLSLLALQGWHTPGHVGGWATAFLPVLILAALAWAFRQGSRWAKRHAANAGIQPSAEEAAEERLWIAGGLLYNNPADPQLMVSKREGTGFGLTVNVGTPKGKWAVAAFLLLVIGIPAGLVLAPGL